MSPHRRKQIGVIAVGIVATALAWLAGPRPATLSEATTGDAALAATVRAALADPTGYRGLAVALIDGDSVRVAGLGDRGDGAAVDRHTAFEIGSIGKVLTGMLLADLAADGVVRPDEPLGDLLAGHQLTPGLAATTLARLASHRSGLASVRFTSVGGAIAMHLHDRAGHDPYTGQDTRWLASSLRGASGGDGDHPVSYSNYGMAVLGYALGERVGVAYPELLDQRVLAPLGLRHTTFSLDGAALPAQAAQGSSGGGRPMAPWQSSGYAGAGAGLWSTVDDLAVLVSATMAGTAPGADAAVPRFADGDTRQVGYGWFTDRVDGQEITWHNGGTGGFRSFIAFDRGAGRGVVVLSNTDREVDTLGRHLLAHAGAGAAGGSASTAEGTAGAGEPAPRGDAARVVGDGPGWLVVSITWFLSYVGGLSLLFVATRPIVDRLRLLTNGAWALAIPALAYPLGAWWAVPTWAWATGVGLSIVALVLAVGRWRAAPVQVGPYPRLRWVGSVLVVVAAPAAVAWILI